MRFEWDANKARRNFGKHAVEFEEAATVFADPLFLIFADDEHSSIELRYVNHGKVLRRTIVGRGIHAERRGHTHNKRARGNSRRKKTI